MKQQEIFKKIGVIIKELSDQYEYLQLAEDNLNDLELELFVANANFLTDHIEILAKYNLQKLNSPHNIENKEQMFFEPIAQQSNFKPDEEKEKPGNLFFDDEKQNAPVKDEAFFENKYLNPEAKSDYHAYSEQRVQHPEKEVISPEPNVYNPEYLNTSNNNLTDYEEYKTNTSDIFNLPVTPDKSQQETLPSFFDRNVNNVPQNENDGGILTLNDKISAQLAEKVASKTEVTEQPLSDIKHGITLNDKLLYVKDLFNGYNLAYSEAIEILNRFTNFEEATKFLRTNYIVKNNWESKPETFEKFLALLKRRYA